MTEVLCYNKGCGKTFKEEENTDDVCTYHPGAPVFHDALKGWSCCKKRSTDFTDFLNIPGCTRGMHNPVKPVEPEKTIVQPLAKGEVIEVKAPTPKPKVPIERPPDDEPFVKLKVIISNSLKAALARLKKQQEENKDVPHTSETTDSSTSNTEVAIGTECKRGGCQTTYSGPDSDLSDCQYHPGIPIFHEGYKFWSCCRRRTSDFNEFLRQEGCETGVHLWHTDEKAIPTRYDWHQTGSQVVISVFSKCAVPEECYFTANSTNVKVFIMYEGGKRTFEKMWHLEGVIDTSKSVVELLGTKAEVKLKKSDGTPWKYLELKQVKASDRDNK